MEKFNRKAGLLAPTLLLLSLLLGGCSEAEAPPTPPRPIAWTTVTPSAGAETRQLPGLVRAGQRAPLSFEVPGRVVEVKVEIGEGFEAGQVLARLDDRQFRLTLEERRASLADARARLTEADKTLDRKKELLARRVGSQAAVDNAQAGRDSAAAQLDRLQALVGLAREDLQDTVVHAPYDGFVLQRMIEPSQQVQAGQTVFEVQGSAGQAEVIVSVPETVVGRLALKDRVPVAFPARPDLSLIGRVTEIGAGAVERNAFPVTLALEGSPADLRPGMTAEVHFQLDTGAAGSRDLLSIPVTAFLAGERQQELAFVFNEASQTLQRRVIEIDSVQGDRALVSAGLEPGEIIASKGLPYLHDGQPVVRLGVGPARFQP